MKSLYFLSAAMIACCPIAAFAQVEAGEDQELRQDAVIVTAQKREQDISDVPTSVAVVAGEELNVISSAGVDILFLRARVPSVNAESSFGRAFPRFYIRGLGNTDFDLNANQPVSLIYDEVVLENPILKGFPVFDLQRIEVLRGPQGTLFGRNTPAGIIKFESARPTFENEGYGSLTYGRFNTVDVEAAISGPLIEDQLAFRISGQYQRRDDTVDNTFEPGPIDGFENFDEFAGRLQFLFKPTDDFTGLLNAHGRYLDGGSRTFRANAFLPGTNEPVPGLQRDEAAQDAVQFLNVRNFGVNLKLDWDVGPVTLTSVSAWENVTIEAQGDVDGGFGAVFAPPSGPGFIPFPAESRDDIDNHNQLTQELRAQTRIADRIDFTAGFFLFYEDLDITSFSFDTLAGSIQNGLAVQNQETFAWALFGAVDIAVTERLSIAGGIRFSDERKDFTASRLVGPFGSGALLGLTANPEDGAFSWDVSATYAVTDSTNVYVRAASSFRAPAIQGRILFGNVVTVADTERNLSLEGGIKGRLPGNIGRYSVSGFWFDLDDQQLTAVGGAGNFNQLLNADQTRGLGFEFETQFEPIERLLVTTGVSFNRTEIQDPDLEVGICGSPCTVLDPINPLTGNALIDGNPLPNAPRWIANWTLRYSIPMFGGEIFAFTDWAYRSRVNFFLYESAEFSDDFTLEGGLRAGYQSGDGRFEIAAFGRNITNNISFQGAVDFNNFTGFLNEPPLWGIEVIGRY